MARQGFGLSRDLFDRYAALFGSEAIRRLRIGRPGGDALAACAALWAMDQWYGGRPIPTQAVAMVAVDPAMRGAGLGSALMRAVLAEGRASGAALSVLCPATLPFYRRLGYGRGGVTCRWSAPPTALIDGLHGGLQGGGNDRDGALRPTDPLEAAPLAALRRPMLAGGNGVPERNEALWTLALCPDGEPADVFLLEGGDGRDPEGYIAVTPPRNRRLSVADLCVTTGRSARLALRFLAGYRAQVDRVVWRGGPDDPLALLAEDGVRMDGREEWLLRVLDVRAALTGRGYPDGVAASVQLDLTDPLIPANHGRFRLRVADGRAAVAADAAADTAADATTIATAGQPPVAALGIAAFASLFTGHASARSLRQTGLLRAGDGDGDGDEAVALLDRLFGGARPWMPDRF